MNRFTAWADQLSREGKLKSGGPLETIGKTLTSRNMVIDGPFAESKEAVAGFFVILAASLDEAVETAKGCPGLDVGQTIEVRAFTTDPFENEIAQINATRKRSLVTKSRYHHHRVCSRGSRFRQSRR
jgi:hypothetical protein